MTTRFWNSAFFAALLPLIGAPHLPAAEAPPARSRVIRAVDPQSVNFLTPDANRVRKLFNAALLQYTQTQDVGAAWKKIVSPSDRVGIKINSQPGPVMSSRPSLVETIVDGLELAGVPRNQVIIFDRYAPQMEAAGYWVGRRPDGVTIAATTPHEGYDPNPVLDFPIPGKLVWGDLDFRKDLHDLLLEDDNPNNDDQLSTQSHFSKILTRKVDKVINLGVPITDPNLGLYGCELNVSLSLIDNFRRLQRPSFTREDSLTEIFSNPVIQKKCVLHILDALIFQYAGGPLFDPSYCKALGALYLSRDAVALDSLALTLINQQRPSLELAPITSQAAYHRNAADARLGNADPSRMDVQEVTLGR